MGAEDISERQTTLLRFIEQYIEEQGRPPTNREIGSNLGIPSTGHVNYHLTVLEKKGFISREQRTSRGIRVTRSLRADHDEVPANAIPIMGSIAAGEPLEFFRDNDSLEVMNPASYAPGTYALRVKGESMIEDGILNGDFVVIEPNIVPNTRDIIVATNIGAGAEGAATLKRFFREDHGVRLQPANSTMQPIFVPRDDWNREWSVQGRVAAVIRSYKRG